MPMDREDIISVLNDLIETCEDGVKGFRMAADAVTSREAKTVFNSRARLIEQAEAELKAEVRRLGGDPENRGSVSGALHRGWINLKSAITGKDDEAILAEAERGEDVAVKNYQDALKKDLPPEILAPVEGQYQGVLQNRERVRTLRAGIGAARSERVREREADRGAPPP